nr:immunoglobulin heavy chain junction region [Macaca mulatta]MOX59292.1 immunoglobulin heavy chain junction region [Macaca mulatta]MOX59628.1 immunoglobulin heavy chain junction region [Macaca mulatta]MOX67785.1 immunoglobulin heavy chain junction region [Macaca mulatta]MOX68449.1 immunoglobulin heavy chain junction region [Macaca mulatta]
CTRGSYSGSYYFNRFDVW